MHKSGNGNQAHNKADNGFIVLICHMDVHKAFCCPSFLLLFSVRTYSVCPLIVNSDWKENALIM